MTSRSTASLSQSFPHMPFKPFAPRHHSRNNIVMIFRRAISQNQSQVQHLQTERRLIHVKRLIRQQQRGLRSSSQHQARLTSSTTSSSPSSQQSTPISRTSSSSSSSSLPLSHIQAQLQPSKHVGSFRPYMRSYLPHQAIN